MGEEKTEAGVSSADSSLLENFFPLPFLLATLVYCAVVFWLSSISSFPVPSPFSFFDKIVHFFLFAGLSTLVALGLHRARHRYSVKMLILIPILFSILYGFSDEIHQLSVPWRNFSAGDLAADASGAMAAAVILLLVNRVRKTRR